MGHNITDWMLSWGWRDTGSYQYSKFSPAGIIIAVMGDSTWRDDCIRAAGYEEQLTGTLVQ